ATSEWFTTECIGTIATWDELVERFTQKFYNLFDHDEEEEADDNEDPDEIDNVSEIFDTPFSDIDGYCNGGELPGMVRVGRMTYFQDHKWKFEIMKYTFEADEEYVAIKELINHSETNVDPRCAYRELFHKMDNEWLVTRATE
ncbi:hypothetical protein Tco_1576660, partial [Tanacetum coccineum]